MAEKSERGEKEGVRGRETGWGEKKREREGKREHHNYLPFLCYTDESGGIILVMMNTVHRLGNLPVEDGLLSAHSW